MSIWNDVDLPIAKEDMIVHDDALNIDRKIIAGQPVPPDLLEAYEQHTGTSRTKDDESKSKAIRAPERDKAVKGPGTSA
jgi:hypothetical protein